MFYWILSKSDAEVKKSMKTNKTVQQRYQMFLLNQHTNYKNHTSKFCHFNVNVSIQNLPYNQYYS
jgi:hypothetical protein